MKKEHFQELKASGISEEIINLNFQSLEGDNVYEYLAVGCTKRLNSGMLPKAWINLYEHCTKGGWWCSGIDLVKGNENYWGCFKADFPRLDEFGLKPIKYEHPKGYPTDLFALRIGSLHSRGIHLLNDIKFEDPDLFWDAVIANPEIDIVVTEGAKKAACLLSHNQIAVGLPGIWGAYRRELKETHQLIPAIAKLATEGRTFIFAFDQDAKTETRKQVKAAFKKTKECLAKFGCRAVMATWDEQYKGVDDLIVAEGVSAWVEARNKALETKVIEVKTSQPLKEPEGYEEDNEPDYPRIVSEQLDPEYPYNVQAVEEIYKSGHYISFEERLYKFNGKFYEKCDPGEEKQKIRAWAEQTPVYDPRTKRETYKYLGTRYLNEIWNWTLITFAIKPELTNPPGLNLANGVLRVHIKGKEVSWELTKHSPKDYFLYCSDVEFNPDANPEFCDRLLECLDPAPRTAFLRQVGAALDLEAVRITRGRDIRAAICRGSGSNGKDSLHEAIALIFTDNQICSAGFNQFIAYDQGRQFTLAKLRGAKINWAPENNKNNSLDGSQSLNQAISGDRGLEYERKGKDADPFIPQCVHFFNVNQLPKITTGLESIMSRFAVYEFNKTFSMNPNPAKGELQADPRFKYDKQFIIKEVCPSLLNKMLAELKNLLIEGIDYNAIKHSLDDIQEESTHLWSFCHDLGITASEDNGIYITELWKALQDWYIETGTLEPLPEGEKGKPIWHDQANPYDRNITGPNQIAKRFKTLFPKITADRETRDPKNKGRFYLKGLKCNNSASLLHFPINPILSASPSASLSFTSSSLTTGEAKSEDKKELVKQETLTQQGSEAVKQKNTHQALNAHKTRREELLDTVFFWKEGLKWDNKRLKAFAKSKIGLDSSLDMNESQLYTLGQLLSKEIPLQPKQQEF